MKQYQEAGEWFCETSLCDRTGSAISNRAEKPQQQLVAFEHQASVDNKVTLETNCPRFVFRC
jgi:hypothetical protein